MPRKRVATGETHGLGDTPENQNEEFGRGDQEFGGGPGELEYGEAPPREGVDEGAREADTGVEDAAEQHARERKIIDAEHEETNPPSRPASPPHGPNGWDDDEDVEDDEFA
jgi:hypothetical protein